MLRWVRIVDVERSEVAEWLEPPSIDDAPYVRGNPGAHLDKGSHDEMT